MIFFRPRGEEEILLTNFQVEPFLQVFLLEFWFLWEQPLSAEIAIHHRSDLLVTIDRKEAPIPAALRNHTLSPCSGAQVRFTTLLAGDIRWSTRGAGQLRVPHGWQSV